MRIRRLDEPRQASMAAEPVSPLVAPSIVPASTSLASSLPNTWRAWSLKERVGPQKSSITNRSPMLAMGATSGGSKRRAASLTRSVESSAPNSSSEVETAAR